jgi:hypothetical protein
MSLAGLLVDVTCVGLDYDGSFRGGERGDTMRENRKSETKMTALAIQDGLVNVEVVGQDRNGE